MPSNRPPLEFVVEKRGDLYAFGRPGDTPIDPQFYDDIKASLIFPIPGLRKLSLAPTHEWIVFRNKNVSNTYYAINTFVSLTYNYDCVPGTRVGESAGFQQSNTTTVHVTNALIQAVSSIERGVYVHGT
jgi:hypothetical protein